MYYEKLHKMNIHDIEQSMLAENSYVVGREETDLSYIIDYYNSIGVKVKLRIADILNEKNTTFYIYSLITNVNE